MSDYKRFISYIYDYQQGEKGENKGFVKVNARGGECRIQVHVKGYGRGGEKPLRVYAFRQKKQRLEGRYLGDLENRNGALEWNGVTMTDSLMGGFALEESRGIYIEGEGRVLAAEWDDYPVAVDRFDAPERYVRQVREDARVEAAGSMEVVEEVRTELPEETSAALQTETSAETSETALTDPRKPQWDYLAARFRELRYQDADRGVLSGIRLGSRELSRIPRDRWGLGNNSFLLHGLYQHHHLLLIRREMDEQVKYYIGVPGIYNEKEQMLASMFGFEEYRIMKGPEDPQPQEEGFGYWCRALR